MAASFISSVATDFTGAADAIGGAVVLLFSAALGASIRYRHTARDQLIERAKLQERELLARELHDTVAHHVSAIAIQAQAGLFLAGSSSLSGAVEALEIIPVSRGGIDDCRHQYAGICVGPQHLG
ncbi:MAG: histidine kinase dimerization/phosphoacceptor domain-containing protein [Actinomycetota bacterium]|nr:histidine kinase dimerization/phosphoacceptor domain-containing protein [Actinomycetota bacterium]